MRQTDRPNVARVRGKQIHDVLIGKPNRSTPPEGAMSSVMARALYLDIPAEPFLSPTVLIGVLLFLLLLSYRPESGGC
jgi:hypothetical protein